jgi:hypothetical protein
MKRFDWVDRLWETIGARTRMPFAWGGRDGSQDCCTFAAACVDAMTGSNLVEHMQTRYHDDVSAQACINDAGGLEQLITNYIGPTKPIARMSLGDVVLCRVGPREFIGICIRDRIVAATEGGLGEVSKKHAIACWSA